MSEYMRIEKHLSESFQDFKLSKDEKYSLQSLLENLKERDELLSFARNKAFDIYRDFIAVEADDSLQAVNWLEKVIKTIDGVRNHYSVSHPSAHFSPGVSCANQIINSIRSARSSVDICVFTISDNRISEAILAAHESGKQVRVISDNHKAEDRGSDVYFLAEKGVAVKLDQSPHHMHHKFALFDKKVLINGSFNWTRSASVSNEENITVLYDPSLINSFSAMFEALWQEAEKI